VSDGAGKARARLPRGVVGIDLGTSHTALAFAECVPGAKPAALPIRQWVGGRRSAAQLLLPSVAYSPLEGELSGADAERWVTGEYARIRSEETIGRGITSAKSWLCHSGVDRLGKILPWGASAIAEADKLSPVEVSRRILVQAFAAVAEHHPAFASDELAIVITVPASFDQTARQLTVMAAERAGLAARLLEEPQAAFYEYVGQHRSELETLVAERGPLRVLVCDVGGGTTDLSLIDVARAESSLALRRTAVGRHLLLGGDNMDLAIARRAEQKLAEERHAGPLDPGQLGQLRIAARSAKEQLLAPSAAASHALTIVGAGSDLFAGSLRVELSREEVREIVLEGFFPLTPAGQLPDARRSGLTTLGLPFERDPAITRHIAQFLERHASGSLPDALLFNGGVMRSELVRARLADCLRAWGAKNVVVLSAHDPDLAVCRGAVRYGLALAGHGPRIEGGAAQGYYVAIDAGEGGGLRRGLCVVPRGSKEGERHVLASRRFELLLGRPARFELYAHDSALHPPGASVELDADYQPLPPLSAVLTAADRALDTRVRVQLDGELSAVGTVELGCTLVDEGGRPTPPSGASAAGTMDEPRRRFQLAFELGTRARGRANEPSAAPVRPSNKPRPPAPVDARRWHAAEEALVRVFGKGRKDVAAREVKDLSRTLERALGPRKDWDVDLSRRIADLLLADIKARLRSEDHERAFWMLAGFCLRPGFGHPSDPERIARLWPSFDAGLSHNREAERGWQQYWIAWRRIAGGLTEPWQTHVRDVIDPGLSPAELKLKKPKHLRLLAPDELLELASQLERVPAARRSELGRWLLDRTWSDRDPRLWTYIGRIGARVPAYASAHHVLAGSVVERWLEQLLRERWNEVSTAAASAFVMSRVSGDETRDIAAPLRAEVARALERAGAPEEWRRAVLEYVPVTSAEREARFADDLPLGLRLVE
jgi:molecular chaperone DnaK (HSP70)